MDILKLLGVFAILIIVMWAKKPLSVAMFCSIIGAAAFYQLPLSSAWSAVVKGGASWPTLEVLLVFYSITFIQRMMEKRKNLSNCEMALNGLFNNRRVNVAVAPFLIGCLPAVSAVLLCSPIVRKSAGEALSIPEKAACTSYFRHISESFLPTYTTIFIAVTLTNGTVTVSDFMTAMLPMVVALFISGYVVYLRRIPKDTGTVPDKTRGYYWRLLMTSVWPIVLVIVLILVFKIRVVVAVFLCIVLNVFVAKFSLGELLPFLRSAFEVRLMANTWLVMIFKEILAATGVISKLPAFFGMLPLPTFMIFAMVFFFGTIVAGSQGIIALAMPLLMSTLAGKPVLAMFILVMSMSYAAMQMSPVHVCLTICAEDYGCSLGALIYKTLPIVLVFVGLSFAYYFVLSWLGF